MGVENYTVPLRNSMLGVNKCQFSLFVSQDEVTKWWLAHWWKPFHLQYYEGSDLDTVGGNADGIYGND